MTWSKRFGNKLAEFPFGDHTRHGNGQRFPAGDLHYNGIISCLSERQLHGQVRFPICNYRFREGYRRIGITDDLSDVDPE